MTLCCGRTSHPHLIGSERPGTRLIILAVGDSYMAARYFRDAFRGLESGHEVEYFDVDANRSFDPSTASECKLGEYQGSPVEVAEHMPGVEVLVVHGAPVTDTVLAGPADLRLPGGRAGGAGHV